MCACVSKRETSLVLHGASNIAHFYAEREREIENIFDATKSLLRRKSRFYGLLPEEITRSDHFASLKNLSWRKIYMENVQ